MGSPLFYALKRGDKAMAKSLSEWILELKARFDNGELEKEVVRAKITIGLTDPISGEIQYHALEYTAKDQSQSQMVMKQI
jgi:hypothetical protein